MKPFVQSLITATLPCWVIGHRGAAAVCPENTLSSFSLARDAGACMIEFDIQQSEDGELFVFHDDTLERLCGEPVTVGSLNYKALSARVIGRYHGESLTIPRLAEVFSTYRRSLLYNIELKTNSVISSGIESRLVELVHEYGLTERVLVSSFCHESLRNVHEHDAHLALGLLLSLEQGCGLGSPEAMVARAQEFVCFSVHPDFRLLRLYPALVEQCHLTGLRVFPWTVDHPHVWHVLVNQLHVDGVITNDPAKLYDWLLKHTKANGTGSVA
ncbi:MAG: glycerophosphodiester phosphodiesterase [Candidatus Binatia bacterium]